MSYLATDNSQPATKVPRLFLIDGSGYIFRAYHSLPPLTRPGDGTPVGAVYGFSNMLHKLVTDMHTHYNDDDYVAVIFDAGRKTFRHTLYAEYKANRPPPPEDLIPQFPLVREATRAFNLPAIELEDYEADDLIATYARLGRQKGMEVVIVSSDKDLMQLVGEGVRMYDPMKQKPVGEKEVQEKFSVPPDKVLDVLSLMGDSSDNVPGVPGIGPKTAAELINQYGDLDTLLARAGEIKQPKRRESLLQFAEQAKLSRELIKLCDNVPVPVPLEEFVMKRPDPQALIAFLNQQGFKSLIVRVNKELGVEAPVQPVAVVQVSAITVVEEKPAPKAIGACYTLVQSEAELEQWIAKARQGGRVAFDTETTSLDAMRAELVGFSLCTQAGEACYVPLNHVGEGAAQQSTLFETRPGEKRRLKSQIEPTRALDLLQPLLADPAVLKVGQNIKYDMLVLAKHQIAITPVEDTMLMSYVLAAGLHPHNMDELAERYLHCKTISYDDVTGTGRGRISFAEVPLERARDYAAEDADITLRLADVLKPMLVKEKLLSVYETLERPLIPVLVAMEASGVKVDRVKLKELSAEFATQMKKLEIEICGYAGCEFNIASPKQLGEILFEKLGLEGGRKSGKTGAYVTDAAVLEDLAAQGHELPAKVLEWRQYAKLKSTYTDALEQQINPMTGRVHTSYAMAIASTGRLSSTDPNLQNIPIRTEEGRKIRTAFIAEDGNVLLSADYSQIELRLLAHVADIPSLKEAFRNNEDIHAATASQVFGVALKDVTPDLRRSAKTVNFGLIYGMGAHGLAMRLGIGRAEAGEIIKKYFAQYPGIAEYMEQAKATAREKGYVTTLFGRRVHLPGINNKNHNVRAFSERAAINAPLQGTAADIIKRAMISIYRALLPSSGGSIKAAMLLQVHDELVFEVTPADAEALQQLVKKHMESAASLSVPLVVETGIGANWGAVH